MLKRLCLAFAGLFALISIAQGAGTVPGFSLTPQFDLNGKIMPGCKLFIIQAGTVSTPQNAYQDSGLTLLQPNPMLCDASGRIGQFFVADGNIKLRLTDKNGVQIFVQDGLLVVGASSGGGGGSPVDPTTILATGDFKLVYNTGIITGFVRCNGRTIGSATSGATERANADTSALFTFLWGVDSNLAVSGGRGANASADYAANKTIALPDCRSRAIAGLGDMGNSDNALFSGVTFTYGTSTTLGGLLGAARKTLAATNIPPLISSGSNSISVNDGSNNIPTASGGVSGDSYGGGANSQLAKSSGGWNSRSTLSGVNTINVTTQGTNATTFDTNSPFVLTTIYIKL